MTRRRFLSMLSLASALAWVCAAIASCSGFSGSSTTPDASSPDSAAPRTDASAPADDGSPTTTVDSGVDASNVTAIGAGGIFSCAIVDSQVYCWGDNGDGELGDGTKQPRAFAAPVSQLVDEGIVPATLSVGYAHACILTTTGVVYCWGDNQDGEVGPNGITRVLFPNLVAGLPGGVIAVTTGLYHSCALTTAGDVYCWGANSYGQTGSDPNADGGSNSVPTPFLVPGLPPIAKLWTLGAGYSSCAIDTSGNVWCWGFNTSGQLGLGTPDGGACNSNVYNATPVKVPGVASPTLTSAGNAHTCALIAGQAWCWGDNGSGEVGLGMTGGQCFTAAIATVESAQIVSLTTGRYYTCVITNANAAKCWGDNSIGQLGAGTFATSSVTPQQVVGLPSGVVGLSAGYTHACAYTASNKVLCWGDDTYGALGDGVTAPTLDGGTVPDGGAEYAPVSVLGLP